ncbi:MAG: vWA domain-containing protein [Planctomycetota bacterium]|jgi:hypothetical protein
MPVEFRCEHCDAMLAADADAGVEVQCPECGQISVVPAGLASLPSPQMPGEELPAADAGAPPPPPPPAPETSGDEQGEGEEGEEGEEELEEEFREPSSTMKFLSDSVPWVISVFLNVGILVILSLISIFIIYGDDSQQITVPSAELVENPGGTINPNAQATDPSQQVRPRPTERFSETESRQVDTSQQTDAVPLIGQAAGGSAGGSPLGQSGGGGGVPSRFLGQPGGNAHHIVYVIDRSGSMQQTWPVLRSEMLKSIGRLDAVQDFHVIFFAPSRNDPAEEKDPRQLTPATDQYKIRVADFLDTIQTSRATVAAPALKRAFEVLRRADTSEGRTGKLVYVLSDGQLSDWPEPRDIAREMNRDKGVHINTFLYSTTEESDAAEMLKEIAAENGGRYKHVDPYKVY